MTPILEFPSLEEVGPEGILAVGGDLHPHSLKLAYRQGIFPWPIEGIGLAWFCPDPRAILEFSDLHVPRSLKRAIKKMTYDITVDQAFSEVIQACARQPRQGQQGTWITPNLKKSYERFHELGFAHSLEVWQRGTLIGGVYGVAMEGVFAAESMFHRIPNASKIAVLHLVDYLRSKGATWMDIQVLTPHMEMMGAKEISRREYLQKLKNTQGQRLKLF